MDCKVLTKMHLIYKGRIGYYGSAPPTPSYYHNNDVYSWENFPNSYTDRFYGPRGTMNSVRRSRSNSFPLIR
jgi:hypothetical protein